MPQERHIKPQRYNPKLGEQNKAEFPRLENLPRASISHGTTMVFPTGGWRSARPVFEDRVPPCIIGCPTGVNIEQYMICVAQKRYEEAAAIIRRDNPIPATTGRVCFHPCQAECNRRDYDGAVQVQAVERFIGDKALDIPIVVEAEPTGRSVAVIGSGPAGLSFAYQALTSGVHPVVIEREETAGGILATGIPEYRLPKEILAREIALLKNAGVEFRTGTAVGKDISFKELADEYDAVFVATGYHKPRGPEIPGADTPGVQTGLRFLYQVNCGEPAEVGRQMVVVGGGNTAMDAARCAIRLGAQVSVVYRRTREVMPAIREEVEEAEAEDVRFNFLLQPTEILVSNGRVRGMRCTKMALGEVDASGRRRPVPVPGEETEIACDTVILATGEEPDFSFLPEGSSVSEEGFLKDSEGNMVPGVLFGGDLTTVRNTVAHALGSGKRAFKVVERYLEEGDWRKAAASIASGAHSLALEDTLSGRTHSPETIKSDQINTAAFEGRAVHKPPRLGGEALYHGFRETTTTFSERTALQEASRCFNCGICNMCFRCFAFCPDSAIRPREDGQGFDIDYEYCKGCGICVEECPRGAMRMVWEEK